MSGARPPEPTTGLRSDTLARLVELVDGHARGEGVTPTPIDKFALYRTSVELPRTPELETPAVVLLVQGTKICHYDETSRRYTGPRVVVGLFPAPLETEFLDASPDRPFLAAGVHLDTNRLADLVLRLDELGDAPPTDEPADGTAKFSLELTDDTAAPFIRLLEMVARPVDLAVLGSGAIDEIYYRLLTGPRGRAIRHLLQRDGNIRRISRAVHHIHEHLAQPVVVDDLAAQVHMSRTAFYTAFREVMGTSPLQYAKSVKLLEAQRLLQEGRSVAEAGHAVGYANLSQFSREFRRRFGHPPSTVGHGPG
ncbi:MAG: AraC family transcriptional regulator [Actinomycetota bacterium]